MRCAPVRPPAAARAHRARRAALALPWLGAPATAHAAAQGTGYGSLILSLLVVLGVFVALAWLARRFFPAAGGRGALRVVASLSLGTRERVVVVELGEELLVLGLGGGQVNLLARLPASTVPSGKSEKEEA